MKDENGDMAPDEDSEAVEISRCSRNREISGGVVGKLSGGRPMKDESGDMAPDEDREAVEISRDNRNREISGGVVGKLSGGRRLREESLSGNFLEYADSERKASQVTFGRASDER